MTAARRWLSSMRCKNVKDTHVQCLGMANITNGQRGYMPTLAVQSLWLLWPSTLMLTQLDFTVAAGCAHLKCLEGGLHVVCECTRSQHRLAIAHTARLTTSTTTSSRSAW